MAGTPKHPRKAWSSKAGQMPLQCLDTSGRFGRLGPDVRVGSSHASKWGCSSGDHTLSNLCIMGIPRIVKVKATSILATPATLCYQSMVVVYLILLQTGRGNVKLATHTKGPGSVAGLAHTRARHDGR